MSDEHLEKTYICVNCKTYHVNGDSNFTCANCNGQTHTITHKSNIIHADNYNNDTKFGTGYCATCLNISEECTCFDSQAKAIKEQFDISDVWFNEKLVVGSYPYMYSQFFNMEYDIVINVSDEFYYGTDTKLTELGAKTFWFPMSEKLDDIGLNSIYGALVVLYNAKKHNKSVYLHCHAGVNRSQIVKAACYYMMNNEQFDAKDEHITYINRLVKASHEKMLPSKDYMEQFLNLLGKFLNNFRGEPLGGLIDEIKLLIK